MSRQKIFYTHKSIVMINNNVLYIKQRNPEQNFGEMRGKFGSCVIKIASCNCVPVSKTFLAKTVPKAY